MKNNSLYYKFRMTSELRDSEVDALWSFYQKFFSVSGREIFDESFRRRKELFEFR